MCVCVCVCACVCVGMWVCVCVCTDNIIVYQKRVNTGAEQSEGRDSREPKAEVLLRQTRYRVYR